MTILLRGQPRRSREKGRPDSEITGIQKVVILDIVMTWVGSMKIAERVLPDMLMMMASSMIVQACVLDRLRRAAMFGWTARGMLASKMGTHIVEKVTTESQTFTKSHSFLILVILHGLYILNGSISSRKRRFSAFAPLTEIIAASQFYIDAAQLFVLQQDVEFLSRGCKKGCSQIAGYLS